MTRSASCSKFTLRFQCACPALQTFIFFFVFFFFPKFSFWNGLCGCVFVAVAVCTQVFPHDVNERRGVCVWGWGGGGVVGGLFSRPE